MGAPLELVNLCQQEQRRLTGVLGLLVGDRHLAEELTQETFIRACRDWDKVSQLDRPGAWLHRVAVNLAMSTHRRRGAERRMLQRVQARSTLVTEDPDSSTAELVRQALRALPIDQRAVIVLRFYGDCSVEDTAAALGIPEGTVKTRTRRALAALRESGLLEANEVSDVV